MAQLLQGVGTGYKEPEADVLLIVYMLNVLKLKKREPYLLAPQTTWNGPVWLEMERYQKKLGIPAQYIGKVTNGSLTWRSLHRDVLGNESLEVDKSWERNTGSITSMKKVIENQRSIAAARRSNTMKQNAERQRSEEILNGLSQTGLISTIWDVTRGTIAMVGEVLARLATCAAAASTGKVSVSIAWIKNIAKSVGWTPLVQSLTAVRRWSSFLTNLKALRSLPLVGTILVTGLTAGWHFMRGQFSRGITEVCTILYSVTVWPAAIFDFFETIMPEYLANTVVWRFLKQLNPARHAKVVFRTAVLAARILFEAIVNGRGNVTAALNDFLKWFQTDETLAMWSKKDNEIQALMSKMIEFFGDPIEGLFYVIDEIKNAVASLALRNPGQVVA